MKKILNIKVSGFSIKCTLDNGDVYLYNMSFILNESSEMVGPLKDEIFFSKVFIEYGSLCWPNGYDIHVNTIIREGTKVAKPAS
jgi:hypothetical protein